MAAEYARFVDINEDQEVIMESSNDACKILKAEYNIQVPPTALPTIMYEGLKSLVVKLAKMRSKDEVVMINYMNLLDLGVEFTFDEDAEKTGSFEPIAVPGQEFRTIIKNDAEGEEEDEDE